MCARQSTYTLSSTPGSARLRNKTSSPINTPANNMLEALKAAERTASDLHNRLANLIHDYAMEDDKDNSSMSSLVLDVSKISVLKATETSKAQFASSPNLSGMSAHEDAMKSRLKRYDSASTSNLLRAAPKNKEGKLACLRRISPKIFKSKEAHSSKLDKSKGQDGKSKLNSLFKPKIVTPLRTPKADPIPTLSTSSRKKFSDIKSTIPRLAKKE